jgi:hypothetical protein
VGLFFLQTGTVGIKNVAHQVHRWRRRPRFRTPKLWTLLALLLVAALLLLPRGSKPPSVPEPLPASLLYPEPPRPVHLDASPSSPIQEVACPQGCASPPPGCVIKGNISQKNGERIYHLPGQRYYDKTIIVPEDGETWFCTEEEARANGWRKAKV